MSSPTWGILSTGASGQAQALFAVANSTAKSYASSASSIAGAIAGTLAAPPTISVSFAPPPMPTIPPAPPTPVLTTATFSPPSAPAGVSEAAPSLNISTFDEAAPTISLPSAPTISYGAAPVVPAVGDVSVPDAPTIAAPAAPTYLALSTPSFAGIDVHEDWMNRLGEIPTLELAAPIPYSFTPGPKYASNLLEGLKSTLQMRLQGGTGLAPAVEQAIWDRARDRETAIAQANADEVQRQSESLGFQLPPGVLSAQLREAQQKYYDRLSELSRDVSIKQAELEQENLKQAIDEAIKLEGQLVDYAWKVEQLGFESAKFAAENAVQTYNAVVESYKATLSSYQTFAQAYDTVIKAELAQVEVYKGQLAGEETKANINRVLVEQYKAAIDAGMAQVKIYEAQVGAAKTLIDLEATKVSAAGEQIKAYVAQVNAETAKVEAYKASIMGETTKVEVYKTKAQAFAAVSSTQAEYSRALIARYEGIYRAQAARYDGYRAQVEAENARMQAIAQNNSKAVEMYKVQVEQSTAIANNYLGQWGAAIKAAEASSSLSLATQKANADVLIANNAARMDAAKVGAQVMAQLASGAMSQIHATASISDTASVNGNDNFSRVYNY